MENELLGEGRSLELEAAPRAKERWRLELIRRCESLPPEDAPRAAQAMVRRALALPEVESARTLLVCLSFGWEIDTWQLVDRLLASGKQVFVPRTLRRGRRLALHAYPCPLIPTGYGLQQPVRQAPALDEAAIDSTLDAALLPGVGFDAQGYRLGHGGGYFDRFLAGRPFPALGVAYDFQVVERLPHEAHDVPLAAVVTDLETHRPD